MKIPVFVVADCPCQWKQGKCVGLTLDHGWEGFLIGAFDDQFIVQGDDGTVTLVPHPRGLENEEWLLAQDSLEFLRLVTEYNT